MIAFLIFISTLSNVPHIVLLLPVLFILIRNRNQTILLNKHQVYILITITIIVVLSFLNALIHFNQLESYFNLFPYTFLMYASFILAYFLEEKDIELLIKLILLESIIVIFEFLFHFNTIFFWAEDFKKFSSFSILYNSRPYGMSANSSIIALKIFLAILLIDYFGLFRKNKLIFLAIFFLAIIFTFPRTILIVILIYYFLKFISSIKLSTKYKQRLVAITFGLVLVFSVVTVLNAKKFSEKIYDQFTRGGKKIELAGRPIIWTKYFDFIKSHKWFGNYSQKFEIEAEKGKQHAHNSFIQIVANHGFIIAAFFFILLIGNINKHNFIYILVLVIYSFGQYGIFWGISITDLVLFIFFQGISKPDNSILLFQAK